jgi:hypothetical protein
MPATAWRPRKLKERQEASMYGKFQDELQRELEDITNAGLYKSERTISSAQEARISVAGKEVLNMCANNYLGLANNSDIIAAVKHGLDTRGFGMASVRFICGTQDIHHELEKKISKFFGTDDTILYSSCFDANAGLFETLLSDKDAIISDALNHASIIDGIRLCKAARYRYAHADMNSLENCLKEAGGAKTRMIATDGVFSMDGDYAKLDKICDLAASYAALVMVDDSHATGFVGPSGRGTAELFGVQDQVDVITSTLGKALRWSLRRVHHGAKAYHRNASPALTALPIFKFSWLPRLLQPPLKPSTYWRAPGPLESDWKRTPIYFREQNCPKPVLPSRRVATRLCRSCLAMPSWLRKWRPNFWPRGFTPSDFFIRWCPKARPAYGSKFQPPTQKRILSLRWRSLSKSAAPCR